jgi:hypothetical protein
MYEALTIAVATAAAPEAVEVPPAPQLPGAVSGLPDTTALAEPATFTTLTLEPVERYGTAAFRAHTDTALPLPAALPLPRHATVGHGQNRR